MAITDNLLSAVQGFITPDFINKSSRVLGLQPENTKAGLAAAIPTLLMSLINKGSTQDGAQGLLNMVQQGGYASGVSGNFVDRLQDGRSAESLLRGGTDIAQGLFGGRFNSVTEKLGVSTGMNSSSMSKTLALVAPLVMGVLGNMINKNGMNASGLSSFLGQQKSLLSGFIPPGLFGDEKITEIGERHIQSAQKSSRKWLPLALGALFLILGGSWLMRNRTPTHVAEHPVPRETVSGTTQAIQPPAQQQAPVVAPGKMASTDQISSFLASGAQGEMPKRFRFEKLTFGSGSATITPDSKTELNQIATALKDHPSAKVRVEGFTDDTGPATANKALSSRRALTVKEQLISLGIEADRIVAAGFGEESPIASNNTEDGRRQNRRTELVVVQK
jgi:outer membrane protein OmpA-like peptidoglycan-associated protein